MSDSFVGTEPDQHDPFERSLAGLNPKSSITKRDELMYLAGQRACISATPTAPFDGSELSQKSWWPLLTLASWLLTFALLLSQSTGSAAKSRLIVESPPLPTETIDPEPHRVADVSPESTGQVLSEVSFQEDPITRLDLLLSRTQSVTPAHFIDWTRGHISEASIVSPPPNESENPTTRSATYAELSEQMFNPSSESLFAEDSL